MARTVENHHKSNVIGLMTQLDVDETTMQNNHANLE